jgi:hypothetical protein
MRVSTLLESWGSRLWSQTDALVSWSLIEGVHHLAFSLLLVSFLYLIDDRNYACDLSVYVMISRLLLAKSDLCRISTSSTTLQPPRSAIETSPVAPISSVARDRRHAFLIYLGIYFRLNGRDVGIGRERCGDRGSSSVILPRKGTSMVSQIEVNVRELLHIFVFSDTFELRSTWVSRVFAFDFSAYEKRPCWSILGYCHNVD